MQKHILGLGAMLVGVGLMFVFTHKEVSAEEDQKRPEKTRTICMLGEICW